MRTRNIASLAVGLMTLLGTSVTAGVQYDLDDFQKDPVGIGVVGVEGESYFKTVLSPDFKIGGLELGVDFNLYLPLEGQEINEELQSVVFRRVAYDHNNWLGFEWGHLRKVNFGYGLIMDDYDSGSFGSREFTNEKAGFLGYLNVGGFGVQGMRTATEVEAGRITYTLEDTVLLGAPIIFGATAVRDNGIDEVYNDVAINRDQVEIVGADIGVPLGGDFFTLYTEYAKLTASQTGQEDVEGKGAATGFKGDVFGLMNYRLEYRDLEANFVPAYFNNIYETTSFSFFGPNSDAPQENLTGFLASAGSTFLNDSVKAGLQFEKYDGYDTLLTAGMGWKRLGNTAGVVNYRQNFSAEDDNGVLNASIRYFTGGGFDYVTHYQRVFLGDGKFTETYGVSFITNFNKLFSF